MSDMRYCKLVFVLLFLAMSLFARTNETRHRIRGMVMDKRSENVLPDFPVKIKEYNRIVKTNQQGEFLFNMPPGVYTLIFDDYPFVLHEIVMQLNSDTTLVVKLDTPEGVLNIQEVEVIASASFTQRQAGELFLTNARLASMPTMIGERDVLKVLALSAGITSSSEGAADIQVRGSQHGHNLFLLDNIPLYSTHHMFGMVSVFNPTLIRSAEVFKAGFPAEYGGRIASVINVTTKDPGLIKFDGEAEISLISSKLSMSLPLIKNKAALSLSGRVSNYSLINLLNLGMVNDAAIALHFGDINSSFLYKLSDKHALRINYFMNSDGYLFREKELNKITEARHGNKQQNISLNIESRLSGKMHNYFQLYRDSYHFGFSDKEIMIKTDEKEQFELTSGIISESMEDKLFMVVSESVKIQTGISLKRFTFSPFNIYMNDTLYASTSTENSRFMEGGMFLSSKYSSRDYLIDAGIRLSAFGNSDKSYASLEPRLALHRKFSDQFSFSATVAKMSQNIHRVANPGLGVIFEQFYSSDSFLKPQQSWVFSAGTAFDGKLDKHAFSVKADFWYKNMLNLVEFKDGYDGFSMIAALNYIPDNKSRFLAQGKGWAAGVDVSASLVASQYRLTADYTLMQARNQFDEINEGRWFASSTDIRHSLSTTAELKLNKAWTFTAAWQYNSGRPFTLPTAVYPLATFDFGSSSIFFPQKDNYGNRFRMVETERNNARMKPFHKADIAFNRRYLIRNKYNATLSLGVYNLYNRANPSYYFISSEQKDEIYYPVLKSISIFPVLPSFSWGVRF